MIAALALVVMLVGLVGTVVPLVPGLPLVVAAAVGYGVAQGFGTAGTVAIIVIVALGVAATVAGFVLPRRAAGSAGAARSSLLLGLVGAVAGFFVVPVVGLPLGGALGIYLGERTRTGDHDQAWRATVATLKGFGLGVLVQLGAGIAMVLTWVVWVITT